MAAAILCSGEHRQGRLSSQVLGASSPQLKVIRRRRQKRGSARVERVENGDGVPPPQL